MWENGALFEQYLNKYEANPAFSVDEEAVGMLASAVSAAGETAG